MPIPMARKVVGARDLTPKQNERLRPIVVKAIAKAGSQVGLADAIGWSQSTISGFLSGRQGTSYAVARAVCVYVGEDYLEVLGIGSEASAVGDAEPVHPVIARVAGALDYDHDEQVAATALSRGLAGPEMTEDQARELLFEAREGRGRYMRRFGGTVVRDTGTDDPLDDLGGGIGDAKGRGRKKRPR